MDYLSNVKETITDLIRDKGYKQPVLCLSFDSGQGKLLSTGKIGDLEGSPIGIYQIDAELNFICRRQGEGGFAITFQR